MSLTADDILFILGQGCQLRQIKLLDQGAQGLVFEVYDPREHAVVALKFVSVLASEREQPRGAVERLRQEFRLLQSAGPGGGLHLLPVQRMKEGYYKQHFWIWFTMERCQGALAQLIDVLPLEARMQRCLEAMEGLAYVHQQGVSHRDIKPTNLLINGLGHLKIGDFGTAQVLNRYHHPDEESMTVVGTPEYMAPELLLAEASAPLGEQALIACDIFSMGVTVFHVLSRSLPQRLRGLGAANAVARLGKLGAMYLQLRASDEPLAEPLTIPELAGRQFPKTDRVLAQLMVLWPQRRYRNMREAVVALRGALACDKLLRER